jgi:hypothetical protein
MDVMLSGRHELIKRYTSLAVGTVFIFKKCCKLDLVSISRAVYDISLQKKKERMSTAKHS